MKRLIQKPLTCWLAALVLIASVLLIFESDLLWKVQQTNLFLFSSLFFNQQMLVSGGLLSYLGCFFTQFFYHPWLGVLMLCGWWLLLMWLIHRAFRFRREWAIAAVLPVVLLLSINVGMGYWVYLLKLRGYFFVATIGTTAVVSLLWLSRCLPSAMWLRLSFLVVVGVVGYPLLGFYALAALLLMALWCWRLSASRRQNALQSLVAILLVVAVPLLYYRFVYCQTSLSNIWLTALPIYRIKESSPQQYVPYLLLALYFLVLVLIPPSVSEQRQQSKKQKVAMSASLRSLLLRLAVAALLPFVAWHFWYKDHNFHQELAMQRCIEQTDWEGVVAIGKQQTDEPTRAIVMMHNLALSRLGRQLDEMYLFPKGSKRSASDQPIYMFNVAGKLIYYHYGVLNECHRQCVEDGVEHGWNAGLLQYMARCSLLSGQHQAATKYLNLLKQTLFYGSWASQMEELLLHPSQMAEMSETAPILRMLHYNDKLDSDKGYQERYLMNLLASTDSDDPYFQEQAVIAAMWTGAPHLFWARFSHYVALRPSAPVPRIFQEAALLFGMMQKVDGFDRLPIDDQVKHSFNSFIQQGKQYEGMSKPEVRRLLYSIYGHTYFFEYYFCRDLTYL